MFKNIVYLCAVVLFALVQVQAQHVGRCTAHLREFDLCTNDGDWTLNESSRLYTAVSKFADFANYATRTEPQYCSVPALANKWSCCYKTWDGKNMNSERRKELASSLSAIMSVLGNTPGSFVPSWLERHNQYTQMWCNWDNRPYSSKWKCEGRS